MEKKLSVKDLQISFRTQAGILKAVRNISFDLYKGETLAIVGESGSGKSVTNRAIMGISAKNSIIEGGEILYDGQDLVKIDEEDFHKLRGDKIAMIFQDPMSSLNPIMKVGQQLTEAMILKAKSGKRNSRKAFNTLLKRLHNFIDKANANNPGYDKNKTAEMCKTFDSFCIEANKNESQYNEANGSAIELSTFVEDAIFMINKFVAVNDLKGLKHSKYDYRDVSKKILKEVPHTYDLYVVNKEEASPIVANLQALLKDKESKVESYLEEFNKLNSILKESIEKKVPNFFRLGYYLYCNKDFDVSKYSVEELDELSVNYLNENFMYDFIESASAGVKFSHNESIRKKKSLVSELNEALNYFEAEEYEKKPSYELIKKLSKFVSEAIDRLEIHKNSQEYTFATALKSSLDAYYYAIKQNPIEEKKYQKNEIKFNKLISSGKTPTWVLKPQVVYDVELKKNNIKKIINDLLESVKHDIEIDSEFDAKAKVVGIIDFLKEQASKVVVKMNKGIAKNKAIKLLEEVGIPEPRTRFNQYPFELSGGMRQRIVIAIALSANPDILICDEPTTALDVTIQSQILELINKIKRERNLSVIFITHNLGVVANMADRIAVMYAGKIVEYGTADEIFYEPAHPYTWALLSSMPDLNTKDKLESIPGTPPNLIYPPKGDAFAPRNKYALDIDFELQPPLFEITPTHSAATWLLHPNAPKVEMPKIIQDRIERIKKEIAEAKAKEEKGE